MLNESKQTYKAESVSEHVYGLLYEKILSGEWPVDSKIPNEFDLCDAFGASRISVRSAIQRLISMGMLEVKRGDGTYVKSFSLQNYLQQAVPFIVQSAERQEVAQFREALEAQACRLAIEIHNDAEIDELERLFHRSNEAFLAHDVAEYVVPGYGLSPPSLQNVAQPYSRHDVGRFCKADESFHQGKRLAPAAV